MNKGLLTKRIPTILGLLLLAGGLIAGILLVGQQQGIGIKAGPTSVPKNVKVTNLSSTGFTISWITDVPVTGFLKYSDNPSQLTLPAGDVRDQIAGNVSPFTTHYIDVTGLTADKTYYFEIGTGSQTHNDNGKPYQVRTFGNQPQPAEDVSSGKVVSATGAAVSGAIVYVEVTGSQTLSTFSKSDGTFRLALSQARDKDGKYVTYDTAKEQMTILVQAGVEGTATALTNTGNDNPIPDITLGKTLNFIGDATVAIPTIDPVASAGFGTLSETVSAPTAAPSESPEATFSVKLNNPSSEGEQLATTTPEFLGTGPIGTTVRLTVESEIQSGVATVSAEGNWAWSPPLALEPGIHKLTVEFTDALGVIQKFSRSFIVLAAGEGAGLPAFSSTPSATVALTPTATPSATITATPTATESGIPDAGVLTPTVALLIVGIGLFLAGVIWRTRLGEY